MKELIGRTQISIMKIALSDTGFFDNEKHPARELLNELALAGIAWTQTDKLDDDPIYGKVKNLVDRLLAESEPDNAFLQGLAEELKQSRSAQLGTDAKLEKRVRETRDFSNSMDDVHSYVSQKINERVLKGYLDPSIRNLLDTHLHDFLVKLVVREGVEGKSWKPVMSTIDVLLWTVQADKQAGDRERFERIKPRLADNLSKALEIGGASKTKITKVMRQLKQVQEYSFHKSEVEAVSKQDGGIKLDLGSEQGQRLARDDRYMRRVDKIPVDTWIEFRDKAGTPVRCSLASKIDSIDKLFFANGEGRKVVELTRMQLALAMKAGTAKIISQGSLVNRAMNSVINDLKDSTAGAGDDLSQDTATG